MAHLTHYLRCSKTNDTNDLYCRYLFWNDQGYHQIERSRLDGSLREIHVSNDTSNRIYWPNQMTVDDR